MTCSFWHDMREMTIPLESRYYSPYLPFFLTPHPITTHWIYDGQETALPASHLSTTVTIVIHQSDTYFSLHSKFMLLRCDINWTICSLVASFGAADVDGAAAAIDGVGAGAGVDWAFDLNALFICTIVGLFMCSISFLMQNPLPDGTMTRMRWNEQMFSVGLERSRYSPVTVSNINLGWKL